MRAGRARGVVPASVVYKRRLGSDVGSVVDMYPTFVGDGSEWGNYLRQIKARPQWSVARLARETELHRSTIFDWMKGGTGESVTIYSLLRIAEATGDDPLDVFRAAAGLMEENPEDTEIADVLASDIADDGKKEIIASILERRRRDRERRMQDTAQMIRLAGSANKAS